MMLTSSLKGVRAYFSDRVEKRRTADALVRKRGVKRENISSSKCEKQMVCVLYVAPYSSMGVKGKKNPVFHLFIRAVKVMPARIPQHNPSNTPSMK